MSRPERSCESEPPAIFRGIIPEMPQEAKCLLRPPLGAVAFLFLMPETKPAAAETQREIPALTHERQARRSVVTSEFQAPTRRDFSAEIAR